MKVGVFSKEKLSQPGVQALIRGVFVILFVLAIVLRVLVYHIETSDYTVFVSQWYDFIKTHGGFAALKYDFANYNPPYLYLLAIATSLPVPELTTIKTISVVFDIVLGIFTYLILSLKYKRSSAAIIGALVVLFAPTIFINGAAWGQCDAIYTAFCLGSLYFLLTDRPAWACVFFGLAISFKLQAIFFLPVLFVLLLRRRLPLKSLALIPLVFLLMLAPAFIAGRSAGSLLTVYVNQANSGGIQIARGGSQSGKGNGQFSNGGGGQAPNGGAPGNGRFSGKGPAGGQSPVIVGPGGVHSINGRVFAGGNGSSSSLTANAPSFYQWLPASTPAYWKWLGIGLAALLVAAVSALVWASKQRLTTELILKITLVFAIAIPFLLPEMHDRYWYLADVVSIIYAFYFPRLFFIALIQQLCSLLSYAPYLINTEIISLALVAFAVLVIAAITLTDLVLTLYPHLRKGTTEQSTKDAVEKHYRA